MILFLAGLICGAIVGMIGCAWVIHVARISVYERFADGLFDGRFIVVGADSGLHPYGKVDRAFGQVN